MSAYNLPDGCPDPGDDEDEVIDDDDWSDSDNGWGETDDEWDRRVENYWYKGPR